MFYGRLGGEKIPPYRLLCRLAGGKFFLDFYIKCCCTIYKVDFMLHNRLLSHGDLTFEHLCCCFVHIELNFTVIAAFIL